MSSICLSFWLLSVTSMTALVLAAAPEFCRELGLAELIFRAEPSDLLDDGLAADRTSLLICLC